MLVVRPFTFFARACVARHNRWFEAGEILPGVWEAQYGDEGVVCVASEELCAPRGLAPEYVAAAEALWWARGGEPAETAKEQAA